MSAEFWVLVATALFTAGALGITAWEARQRRVLAEHRFGQEFEARLLWFQDWFYDLLGAPDDGVEPLEWRKLMVHYFNFYGRMFEAHRLGLFPAERWEDLRTSLAYWSRRPEIAAAWRELSKQRDAWPAGFIDFIEAETAGAPAAERLWETRAPTAEAWQALRRHIQELRSTMG